MFDFDPYVCTFCMSIPDCPYSLCCQSNSLHCCCSIPSHRRRPWSGSEGSRRSRPCPPRFRIDWGKHKFIPSPPAPPTPSCHRLASSPPHWRKGLRRQNKFSLPLKYFIWYTSVIVWHFFKGDDRYQSDLNSCICSVQQKVKTWIKKRLLNTTYC